MIRKAIIPVAGLGTRFLPATKAQPKEMLTIIDKPVIQYVVEEAVASGIQEVIFVTGRHKRAIEDHFDYAPELERALLQKGDRARYQELRALSDMARFTYVRQREPRGDGDALLAARHLVSDEPVAVLFGDDVIDADPPVLQQMTGVFEHYGRSVVSLCTVPMREVSRYGVVKSRALTGRIVRILDVVEKPHARRAPSRLIATGKYIFTPDIFHILEKACAPVRGELRLADALRVLCHKESVYGYKIMGRRYDCGSKIGLLKATLDFGLRHREVGKEFRGFLRSRMRE